MRRAWSSHRLQCCCHQCSRGGREIVSPHRIQAQGLSRRSAPTYGGAGTVFEGEKYPLVWAAPLASKHSHRQFEREVICAGRRNGSGYFELTGASWPTGAHPCSSVLTWSFVIFSSCLRFFLDWL